MTTTRNRSRRLALVIGVPLALAGIGWGALTEVAWAGQGSYPVRLSIPVRAATTTIAVDAGNLRVGPSTGSALLVTGTAHYSLVRSQVTWTSNASAASVRSQCNSPIGPCSFDFSVAVPSGRRTVISDESGDVYAFGLPGVVTIADDSGNISGSALSGSRVVVQNQSGNITISGLASNDVSAADASGNIILTFSKVPEAVRVANQSGNVTLVLPHGSTAYKVSASTASGQQTVNVPTSPSSPHVITVTDASGDILITRAA